MTHSQSLHQPSRDASSHPLTWMLYDGANSIFHLVGVTILLPWVLAERWPEISQRDPVAKYFSSGEQAWGMLVTLAFLIAGPIAFFLGRIADSRHLRRRFLIFSTAITVICLTLVAGFFGSAVAFDHLLISAFGSILFFTIALSFYDSMLIDATGAQTSTKLAITSGRGWAIGYMVSATVLAALYVLGAFSSPMSDTSINRVFLTVAALFGVISLLLFWRWPAELNDTTSEGPTETSRIPLFLVASFFLNDAMVTISVFVTILATQLFYLSLEETVLMFLQVHLVAIVATWPIGSIITKSQPRTACLSLCACWLLVCLISYFLIAVDQKTEALYFLVIGIGLLIGTTPSTLRSFYAEMIPIKHRSEYFSYTVLTQRSLAFIGPLGATILLSRTSNYADFMFVPATLIIAAMIVFALRPTWIEARQT
jgi:MFS-type transporter involved in bile tolerance (Atg22 family)